METSKASHSVLKGNFKTEKEVVMSELDDTDVTEKFEKEALAKLGGSICFVRKKNFLFDPALNTDN